MSSENKQDNIVEKIAEKVLPTEKDKNSPDNSQNQNANSKTDKDKNKNKFADKLKKVVKSKTFWQIVAQAGAAVLKAVNHTSWWGGNEQKLTGSGGAYATTSGAQNYNMVNTIGTVSTQFHQLIDVTFVENDIEQLIAAVNTNVGFDTGLTADIFKRYITATAITYLTLISYLRDYNAYEYKTVGSKTIGDMIDGANWSAANQNTISIGANMYHYTGGSSAKRTCTRRLTVGSISNHDYEVLLAHMDHMRLSRNMKEYIEYLYGAFFSNGVESGVNSLIIFDNNSNLPARTDLGEDPSLQTYKAKLEYNINSMRAIIAENPYVLTLCDILEFEDIKLREQTSNGKWLVASAYQRDPVQNVINVAADDTLIVALENMTSRNYDSGNDTFYVLTHSEDLTYSTEKDRWTSKTVGEIGSHLKLFYMNAEWYSLSCLGINNSYSGAFLSYNVIGSPITQWSFTISGTGSAVALKAVMENMYSTTGIIDYHQVLGIANTDGFRVIGTAVNASGTDSWYIIISTDTNKYNAAGADVFKHTQYTLIKDLNLTALTMGLDYRTPLVAFIDAVRNNQNKVLNK